MSSSEGILEYVDERWVLEGAHGGVSQFIVPADELARWRRRLVGLNAGPRKPHQMLLHGAALWLVLREVDALSSFDARRQLTLSQALDALTRPLDTHHLAAPLWPLASCTSIRALQRHHGPDSIARP
jgi:hypothetical protein